MKNVFFSPQPHPDAFSTTYAYDAAGNIQTLTRRGIIDMGPGNAPVSDIIDDLRYTYSAPGGAPSSVLSSVADEATNPLAQPLGVGPALSGYGPDGNGNLTGAGNVSAQYNIMNQPTKLMTDAGTRHFAYVYGGGKYQSRLLIHPDFEETRHYLGGIEFVDGEPESYNFGDGRIVYSDSVPPRVQFRLHDHLGNTVVFFEDKNNDGCITTEADTNDPDSLEVIQRFWYYPFGMAMQGLRDWATEPGQWYRYNGKERDTVSGWYEYGFRWYIDEIGRFAGVDPIADQFPWVSVYNYAENRPIDGIDLHGLQWVHFQENNRHVINVNVNTTYGGNKLSETELQSYLSAVNTQFKNTLEKSSNGLFTGKVTFRNTSSSKIVTPGALITDSINPSGVSASATKESFIVSIYDNLGNLQTPNEFALDFIHDLFHTIRLDHPFESTQASDTELIHNGLNSYSTTKNTNSLKIYFNIMNYGTININGFNLKKIWKSTPNDLITSGQLNFITKEISKQQQGAGSYSDPGREDYWLDLPGKRVERKN